MLETKACFQLNLETAFPHPDYFEFLTHTGLKKKKNHYLLKLYLFMRICPIILVPFSVSSHPFFFKLKCSLTLASIVVEQIATMVELLLSDLEYVLSELCLDILVLGLDWVTLEVPSNSMIL